MKLPLNIAIAAVFLSACSGSSTNESTPLSDTAPEQVTAADPLAVVTTPGDTTTSPDTSPLAEPADTIGADQIAEPLIEAPTRPLDEAASGLVTSMAGYRADESIQRVKALVTRVSDTALASRPLAESIVSIQGRYDALNVNVTTHVFDCALGGSLVTGIGTENIYDFEYSADGTHASYRFDGCRVPSGTNGETEINGSLVDQSLVRSGSRFDTREHIHRWMNLALTEGTDFVLRIDGETVIYDENSYSPTANRRVALTLFEEQDTGGDVLRMNDVSMLLVSWISGGGAIEQYRLDAEGTISDASTGQVPVALTTPAALTRARYLGSDPDYALYTDAQPFTGEINLHADDGRYVTVLARDTDTDEFYVDLTSVTAEGTSTARTNVPFVTITVYPPTDDQTAH